jgi:hypothetical protein
MTGKEKLTEYFDTQCKYNAVDMQSKVSENLEVSVVLLLSLNYSLALQSYFG